jgi:hypothetical protein
MVRAAKRRGSRRIALGPGDQGPPERYQHGDTIRSEPGEDAGVFHRRVTSQSALDRYLNRSQISQRQFDAGARLYRLWRATGGAQRVTLSYEQRIPAARELSDDQAVLRSRLTEVLRATGPLSSILVHVCICDEAARTWASSRGDTPQAGVVVLRLALDALGDYWKL